MPSKLRKALAAVKDQTSISLARVSGTNASNLEVLILKATRHDDAPIDDRYINELIQLISSNKVHAAACAQAIGRRIGRTRNWIVALKSLMLVLRIFQDGDPYFPREVLHAMKRGSKILNLSGFRDDSSTSPWDYTAFVRTFALYIDERLDCFITGKLQRRFTKKDTSSSRDRLVKEPVRDTKPEILLHKISYWLKLLDRAIRTRPSGAAKTNRLVNISLYAVVEESFDLYRDISEGLALVLDSFFHLQYQSCVCAFQTCVRASKQFEELCAFYDLCKNLGIGRSSEYPSVQKISDELVQTLKEFLKDQSNFSSPSSSQLAINSSPEATERESEYGSQCTSLEDLMSVTDDSTIPSPLMDLYLDHLSDSRLSLNDLPEENQTSSNVGGEIVVAEPEIQTTSTSSYEYEKQYNPFLQDTLDIAPSVSDQVVAPTFQAMPLENFNEPAWSSSFQEENDPFAPWPVPVATEYLSNGVGEEHNVLQEQQLWLQQQQKIIANHLT